MIAAIYASAPLCAIAAIAIAYAARRQPEPDRNGPGDWFQTMPWRDFLPPMPRLPKLRRPRLLAPKRRGRHVA